MGEQLDDELKDRIKEVFDNYDDTSAGEGWQKLREKFPVERRRRGIIWLWPAAALLLLFLGLGIWMAVVKHKGDNGNKMSARAKQPKLAQPEAVLGKTDSSGTKAMASVQQKAISGLSKSAQSNTIAKIDTASVNGSHSQSSQKNGNVLQKAQLAVVPVNRQTSKPSVTLSKAVKAFGSVKQTNQMAPVAVNAKPGELPIVSTGTDRVSSEDSAKKAGQLTAAVVKRQPGKQLPNSSKTGEEVTSATDSANHNVVANVPFTPSNTKQKTVSAATSKNAEEPNPPKTIYDLFAADAAKTPVKTKSDGKKVRFGVYASTYFNYAKGSGNQVSAGAGFTADIALAGHLKLVTGLSVNQNAFDYGNSGGLYAAPAAYAVFGNNNFQSANNNTNNSQSASLLGLDIPVNLKYEFGTVKTPVYIMTGLSSGTFINQSYTAVSGNYSTTTQPGGGLNDFYFARTFNFAVGIGYPLGGNQIVIEPFLKYPLEGLGAQQIRFGAGGVNLKFNFSTTKK